MLEIVVYIWKVNQSENIWAHWRFLTINTKSLWISWPCFGLWHIYTLYRASNTQISFFHDIFSSKENAKKRWLYYLHTLTWFFSGEILWGFSENLKREWNLPEINSGNSELNFWFRSFWSAGGKPGLESPYPSSFRPPPSHPNVMYGSIQQGIYIYI